MDKVKEFVMNNKLLMVIVLIGVLVFMFGVPGL